MITTLPTDSKERKDIPVFAGFMRYFPAAMVEVARLSKHGNDKHNPGEPLHWSRGKSNDHGDCIIRHQLEAGTIDPDDGFLHDVKVAWRAMAQLQLALEERGAPLAPGASNPQEQVTFGSRRVQSYEDVEITVASDQIPGTAGETRQESGPVSPQEIADRIQRQDRVIPDPRQVPPGGFSE